MENSLQKAMHLGVDFGEDFLWFWAHIEEKSMEKSIEKAMHLRINFWKDFHWIWVKIEEKTMAKSIESQPRGTERVQGSGDGPPFKAGQSSGVDDWAPKSS